MVHPLYYDNDSQDVWRNKCDECMKGKWTKSEILIGTILYHLSAADASQDGYLGAPLRDAAWHHAALPCRVRATRAVGIAALVGADCLDENNLSNLSFFLLFE
eukprot:2422892-Amphidinium_carterae.1